jgi:hypothetical protein
MNYTAARKSDREARLVHLRAVMTPRCEGQRLEQHQLDRDAHRSLGPVPTRGGRDPDRAGDHPGL